MDRYPSAADITVVSVLPALKPLRHIGGCIMAAPRSAILEAPEPSPAPRLLPAIIMPWFIQHCDSPPHCAVAEGQSHMQEEKYGDTDLWRLWLCKAKMLLIWKACYKNAT